MLVTKTVPTEDGGREERKLTASQFLSLLVAHTTKDKHIIDTLGEKARYVGRQGGAERSKFGNPYSHDPRSSAPRKVASRREAVEEYAKWINDAGQAELRDTIRAELRGKVLHCHCQRMHETSPACHAEILVRLANPELAAEADREKAEVPLAKAHLDMRYAVQFQRWLAEQEIQPAIKVLVTGDRRFSAADVVAEQVRELGPGVVVIEGEASGADELARNAALEQGLSVAGFPAQWEITSSTPEHRIRERRDGKRYDVTAGPRRNERMIECEPDLVVGFHDSIEHSKGTKHMLRTALDRGVPIRLFNSAGELVLSAEPADELPALLA